MQFECHIQKFFEPINTFGYSEIFHKLYSHEFGKKWPGKLLAWAILGHT